MKKRLLVVILLSFLVAAVFARDVKISVTDAELEIPLEGVKLSVKGKTANAVVTDENGVAVISVSEKTETVEARLAGYKNASVNVKADDNFLEIKMSITDVIEGQELVVNRASPDTQEEKPGVSTVMTKEKMHTTSNMGLIEDCMASVRTLPGVSFSGTWGSEPSVRGGNPREFVVTLDGMYTYFPWHWGGGISILNPSMIESVKLSNGVFSAKYGKASSGLLEATTLKPDFEKFHLNTSVSTMSTDIFAQIPFGKNVGGMLVGGHLTYLEPLFEIYKMTGTDMLDMINRPPYIRDFFMKAQFNPRPELDIAVTGFFGSDGLSIDQKEEKDGFTTRSVMDYDIYQVLGSLNIKYLATEKIQLHALLCYNGMFEDMNQKMTEKGFVKYNNEFVSRYSSLPGVTYGGSYYLNEIESKMNEKLNSHLISAKFEIEFELNEKNHLCAGVEEIFAGADVKEDQQAWMDIPYNGGYVFKKVDFKTESNNNCLSDTAGFVTWNYGTDTSLINSEIGLRAEFINVFNPDTGFNKMLLPEFCPRATLTVTPWRDIGKLKKASITTGTGIFVSTPREIAILSDDFKFHDDILKPNTALFAVLGGEAEFEDNWKFKLETYYKYYLSRMYWYGVSDPMSNGPVQYNVKTDGKGHVFGIDAMLEKTKGKHWDGYISYSFVYTRFLNPAGTYSGKYVEPIMCDVVNEWYYPDYHRFHTLNLVSNWHFGKGWTFTFKAALATGTPKKKNGDLTCYASTMEDGTVVQRYTRSSVYSDVLRNEISCPVDIRISYQWMSHEDKVKWEFYFAAQDIFVNLYSPKGDKSYNSHTGKMSDVRDSVDFNIGLPMPSLGLKVQF
ncbi:MAG: TonB-dependent receptor plug domain-containing protein [Treponema sp.]|nr:TonB-dependent receptor plug domain-containing protein [Candidatus Treponema scatequi]